MGVCYSYRQICSLGPVPPRTPDRPDAQVPKDIAMGPCRHGKIGAFYFYEAGSRDDAAFGFFDIEVSVQMVPTGKARLEIYCIADGYQSARGIGVGHPIEVALLAGDRAVATAAWTFPDVICGNADPMSFAIDIDVSEDDFQQLDRAMLLDVEGFSVPCR